MHTHGIINHYGTLTNLSITKNIEGTRPNEQSMQNCEPFAIFSMWIPNTRIRLIRTCSRHTNYNYLQLYNPNILLRLEPGGLFILPCLRTALISLLGFVREYRKYANKMVLVVAYIALVV